MEPMRRIRLSREAAIVPAKQLPLQRRSRGRTYIPSRRGASVENLGSVGSEQAHQGAVDPNEARGSRRKASRSHQGVASIRPILRMASITLTMNVLCFTNLLREMKVVASLTEVP